MREILEERYRENLQRKTNDDQTLWFCKKLSEKVKRENEGRKDMEKWSEKVNGGVYKDSGVRVEKDKRV